MLRLAGSRAVRAVGLGTSQQGAFGHPLFTQQRSFADGDGKSDALEKASTVEDVWRTVEAAGDSMDDKAVLAAFKQVERCARDMTQEQLQQLHASKTFQMLCDMAVSSAGSAPPELLASTIGVLGRLRFGDELVLDSLARELMPSIKQLKADQLAEMVEGLRGAEHSPSVLMLDEVHERLSEMDNVPEKQSEKIHEHLEGLGRDEGNLPNAGDKEQPDRIKYS